MEVYLPLLFSSIILGYLFYETNNESQHIERYEALKIKHLFCCQSCKRVYASYKEDIHCACPHCSTENTYLKF